MTFSPDALRRELNPANQLEELFFDSIVRLSTCAHFLQKHIDADPALSQPETTRRMRLLMTTESKLRYAYEEFRRLKLAAQLQLCDPEQAARPLLAVVASHTSRYGIRGRLNIVLPPVDLVREARLLEQSTSALEASATTTRPPYPGRNAQCPCGSGRKYKHCCLNRTSAGLAA